MLLSFLHLTKDNSNQHGNTGKLAQDTPLKKTIAKFNLKK